MPRDTVFKSERKWSQYTVCMLVLL